MERGEFHFSLVLDFRELFESMNQSDEMRYPLTLLDRLFVLAARNITHLDSLKGGSSK